MFLTYFNGKQRKAEQINFWIIKEYGRHEVKDIYVSVFVFVCRSLSHYYFPTLFHFQKTVLLCIPAKSPGAVRSLPVSIDFSKFIAMSPFSPQYCLPPLLQKYLIQRLFHSLSKVCSFDVTNYSHYWKYPQNIVESENSELNITVSYSGYFFIPCRYNSFNKHNFELAVK